MRTSLCGVTTFADPGVRTGWSARSSHAVLPATGRRRSRAAALEAYCERQKVGERRVKSEAADGARAAWCGRWERFSQLLRARPKLSRRQRAFSPEPAVESPRPLRPRHQGRLRFPSGWTSSAFNTACLCSAALRRLQSFSSRFWKSLSAGHRRLFNPARFSHLFFSFHSRPTKSNTLSRRRFQSDVPG